MEIRMIVERRQLRSEAKTEMLTGTAETMEAAHEWCDNELGNTVFGVCEIECRTDDGAWTVAGVVRWDGNRVTDAYSVRWCI